MDQLFYENQEVTPIGDGWTVYNGPGISGPLPKLGEIYHVDAYGFHEKFPGQWLIRLKELGENDWYFQDCFAPVMPDDQLQEAIMKILPKEEEVGSPV